LRGLALDRRREVLPRTFFRLPSRLALVVTVAPQCIASRFSSASRQRSGDREPAGAGHEARYSAAILPLVTVAARAFAPRSSPCGMGVCR
jgi:hypothetical protein